MFFEEIKNARGITCNKYCHNLSTPTFITHSYFVASSDNFIFKQETSPEHLDFGCSGVLLEQEPPSYTGGWECLKLWSRKGIEIIEAEVCPDYIHMLLSIPPKYVVSGWKSGKSLWYNSCTTAF